MKKLLIILLALTIALVLCGCNKDTPAGNNTPDNVVPPKEQTTSANEPVTEPTQSSEVTTLPTSESEAESSDIMTEDVPETGPKENDEVEIVDGDEEEGPYTDISEVIDIHEFKAYECIHLLNSDKVHAKFMEAISYDGEYIAGSEREIYVLGDEFAYVTDGSHIVATSGEDVIIIDYSDNYICTYEGGLVEEEGDRFGYGLENYVNISSDEENGVVTEVFEIETYGGTITSTWTFNTDGTFTVVDLIDESGAYYYYTFEVLEDTFLKVDMQRASALPAPNNLREISIEEYEENY